MQKLSSQRRTLELMAPEGHATDARELTVPYYVRALALAIPAIFLGLQIAGWTGFVHIIADGHGDFRQLYTAGYMVRSGHAHELYEYSAQKRFQDERISREQIALPFNHLAHEALLYAPFSLARYQVGYCGFLALNIAVLALSYRLLRPFLGNLAQVYGWLPWVLLTTFLPLGIALMQGQDSVILLALLIGAFLAFQKNQEVRAGLYLGLAIFKFQIVIPIAFLHLGWRRWKLFCGFVVSAAFCVLVSFALVGANQMKELVRMLLSMSTQLSSEGQFTFGILPNYMPNLRGLVYGLGSISFSPNAVQSSTLVLSVILFALVCQSGRHLQSTDAFLLSVTAGELLSYHLLIHDFTIMVLPLFLVLDRFLHSDGKHQDLFRSSALVLAAPIFMAVSAAHFYLVAVPVTLFATFLMRSGAYGRTGPAHRVGTD
jgi:hypothetical protein